MLIVSYLCVSIFAQINKDLTAVSDISLSHALYIYRVYQIYSNICFISI